MTIAVAIAAFDEAQILDIAGPMEILRGAILALKATCAWRRSRGARDWAARSACAALSAVAWE